MKETTMTPRISFEFFPPQSLDASFRLWETVQALAPMKPSFVSVTYGAGGTTRTLTHEAVSTIHRNYGLCPERCAALRSAPAWLCKLR
jgi:methylenetetrahydrofolate reductase (NADPH)